MTKGMILHPAEVRALQEDRLTQLRRPIPVNGDPAKVEVVSHIEEVDPPGVWHVLSSDMPRHVVKCPYVAGFEVFVKEKWRIVGWHEGEPFLIEFRDGARMEDRTSEFGYDEDACIRYWEQCSEDCEKAGLVPDDEGMYRINEGQQVPTRWRSSTQMPEWASRYRLHIEAVSVQRLWDITIKEAVASGVKMGLCSCDGEALVRDTMRCPPEIHYGWKEMWEEWYGLGGWEGWCWVYTVRRVEG